MITSKTTSPNSVASKERIPQGRGRRLDCEREFKKIMKDANHEITSRHPTMEGVLLGRNTIPLEAIPNLADPDDFVEKTRISSLITKLSGVHLIINLFIIRRSIFDRCCIVANIVVTTSHYNINR